jgi:hypothetical protein
VTGGVHLSVGREERAKAAQLEALPREEGGNRVRRHRCVGRPRGRGPVGRGGAAGWEKKGMGRGWAERPDGPKAEENYFRIKFEFFEYTKALEICTRRFRRNFDMRIFPKSSYAPQEF